MEIKEKSLKLAEEIFHYTGRELLTLLRALRFALKTLERKAVEGESCFSTDGFFLFYSPLILIEKFSQNKVSVQRELLHTLFHIVYRHMVRIDRKDPALWNLACDIAVESKILELDIYKDTQDDSKRNALAHLWENGKCKNAEAIYYYLLNRKISPLYWGDLFSVDSHSPWYQKETEKNIHEDSYSEKGETPSIYKKADDRPSKGEEEKERSSGDNGSRSEEEKWEKLRRRIEIELSSALSNRGSAGGNAGIPLTEINRERYRFQKFLQSFAVLREAKEINLDEYDLIFYTYGLSIYENLPLIEPLETRETKKIDDFFIAIDTSGSVKGEKVQRFIEATFAILRDENVFSSETKVHILEIDASIQRETVIKSKSDLENYLDNLELNGFGGTDFRPAFEYIEDLLRLKKIRKVNGLLYFTDGDGIYPEKTPSYKTAFVLTDAHFLDRLPNWCMKFLLSEDSLC